MRISVFAVGADPVISKSLDRVSKSAAQLMVRRQLADWITKNRSIQLLPVKVPGIPTVVTILWEKCDGGALLPPRPPEGLLLTYPLKDQTSYQCRNSYLSVS